MNVPHFLYSVVPAGSRPARNVPCPMKEIGLKGAAKLLRVPPAGCHAQSGLKCTGRRPSSPGRATNWVHGETTKRASEASVFRADNPLNGVMAQRNVVRFGWT